MFNNWNYNKSKISINSEHYGRILAIDEEYSHLLFLHDSDHEVKEEKIYCLEFDKKDLEYYKLNMESQTFYQDFESRNLASKDRGNKPLRGINGPRVEIITSPNYPIFLKTQAI